MPNRERERESKRALGFTLIELLVVIAIVAILSVVVILVLNPAGLLQSSRDSNRLSDLQTMNTALGIYGAQGGTSFGSSNLVYLSVPDPSATSSAGDQCQGLGLPSAPSETIYFCESSSTYRSTNGSGWIPVNFSSLSAVSPLGVLPQDPINTTPTGNYYTYATNGSQYIVTAIPESYKTKTSLATNPQIPDYPEVMAQGSNLTISPLWSTSGLVGHWNFEEGSGTTALDTSRNNNNGVWSGNTPYYGGGKVGAYAGNFNGNNDYVAMNTSGVAPQSNLTIVIWAIAPNNTSNDTLYFWGVRNGCNPSSQTLSINNDLLSFYTGCGGTFQSTSTLTSGQWYQLAMTEDSSGNVTLFINGAAKTSPGNTRSGLSVSTGYDLIGSTYAAYNIVWPFSGLIDDVRVYNRVLSASEIAALYNAEK